MWRSVQEYGFPKDDVICIADDLIPDKVPESAWTDEVPDNVVHVTSSFKMSECKNFSKNKKS